MNVEYDPFAPQTQPTAQEESQQWAQHLETFLAPVSERLDAYLDRRVVGNLIATVGAIIQTQTPLTTSELGSCDKNVIGE